MGSLVNALRRIQHGAPLPHSASPRDAEPSPPESEVQVTERLDEVENLLRSALAGPPVPSPDEEFRPQASPSYARQLMQIDPDGNIDYPWQAGGDTSELPSGERTTDLWQPEDLTPSSSSGRTTESWQPENLAQGASGDQTTDPWFPENLASYDAEPLPEPLDMAPGELDPTDHAVERADVESFPHSAGSEAKNLEVRVEEALAYAAKITAENKHLALDLLAPADEHHHDLEALAERPGELPASRHPQCNVPGISIHPIDALAEPTATGVTSALAVQDGPRNAERAAIVRVPEPAPTASAFEQRIRSQWESPRLVQAYQRLAETVQQDVAHRQGTSIVLLGCGDEPDVTDVAASLADVLASHHGARVLLVDANLTRQTLSRQHNVPGGPGLADVCGNLATWEQCLQATHHESVFVLPAGGRMDQKRIRSEVLTALVPRWKDEFNCVLVDVGDFDSPFALPFLEACDASYFVACLGRTPREQAAQAIRSLAARELSPAGCIVTNCLLS